MKIVIIKPENVIFVVRLQLYVPVILTETVNAVNIAQIWDSIDVAQ